jgi:hypothetical protein
MTPAPLTAADLHEPVLPFVRPVPVTLRTAQTIAEAHQAVRAALAADDIPCFYVVDAAIGWRGSWPCATSLPPSRMIRWIA